MDSSKNDSAWNEIFKDFDILTRISTDGFYKINSKTINDYREARLMTKFDHKSQLPTIFANNKLSILPVSRGSYVIGNFETFAIFPEDDTDILPIEFPGFLETLDHTAITSEATAINCLFVSGILHNFTGEQNLYPTVNGRMSSSSFQFNINSGAGTFTVDVENAQVEIDGGYEGDGSLILIEAKNYISDDFLIRQLFYPFKLWHKKITKSVRLVFLTYSNGIFHLREYRFDDTNHYNSIRLVKQQKYAVQEGSINMEIIEDILQKATSVPEPAIPFPQADSFERVVNLCEMLQARGSLTKEEIAHNYDFVGRQSDYYANAARYLGLVAIKREQDQSICVLTPTGQKIFNLNIVQRQKEFIKLILSHPAFSESLSLYLEKGNVPDKTDVVAIMKKCNLYGVDSANTYSRRASTILGWIKWIIKQAQ